MPHLPRLVVTLTVACLLLAAACSDSGSGGSFSPEAFLAQYAAVHCEKVEPCCEQDGYPYDDQWCHENPRFTLPQPEYQVSYDEAAARECIRQMRAARNGCGFPDFTTERACYDVFRPNAELGTPCTYSGECKPPNDEQPPSCLPPGPNANAVCTIVGDPVRAREGERCGLTCPSAEEDASCFLIWGSEGACYRSDGLYCSVLTGTCEVLGDEGDRCSRAQYPWDCRDDLHCKAACDPVTGECLSTGTCARRAGPGEACNRYDFDGCADQGRCLTVDCPSSVSDHARGSSCRDVCVVPGKEGEPCADATFSGFACVYPLFCASETSTCERPRQRGEACDDSAGCEIGLFCDPGERRCQAPRGEGEPCSERIQCASYRCTADPDDDFDPAASSGAAEGTCLAPRRVTPWECFEPPSPTRPGGGPTPTPPGNAAARQL